MSIDKAIEALPGIKVTLEEITERLKAIEIQVQLTQPDGLLTMSEAAEIADVTTATIRNWIIGGQLPAEVNPGGKKRVRESKLRGMISQRYETTGDKGRKGAEWTIKKEGGLINVSINK